MRGWNYWNSERGRGMKYGIYFAYWEKEWDADYEYYIRKAAGLGFDILEIGCGPLEFYTDAKLKQIRDTAQSSGIRLTAGYGPPAHRDLSSSDPDIVKNAKQFYCDLFPRLEKLGIDSIGGGLNSYWPVDYNEKVDKRRAWENSVKNVREVGAMAQAYGIDFLIECLNRFEGYLTNTAQEGVRFCREVDEKNVKLLLDTFHMNIEEDSFYQAITAAGSYMGRLHTGEANRRVPGKGRIPWSEICDALKAISYDGDVVMEPFVMPGGTVGRDIKLWRELLEHGDEKQLDSDAKEALEFLRNQFNKRQKEG